MDVISRPPSVPGRGLDGFFSVAKYSMTTLLNSAVVLLTQANPNIPTMTPDKVNSVGRINYLENAFKKAKEQPQLMFQTPLQTLHTADKEPSVIASREVAKSFEKVASYNLFILIASIVALVFVIWYFSEELFQGITTIPTTLSQSPPIIS